MFKIAGCRYLLATTLVICATGASAQEFPNRIIRILTNEAGGGNDIMARVLTQGLALTGGLGQNVIVENRPGASGSIAADAVAKSAPNGYTLLVYSNNFWTLPFIQKVPYDVERDFAVVALMATAPNVLVVHPSLPVRSVKDLIALATARPGELNFASGGMGSSPHLAGELFKQLAGVNMVHVLYKGGAQTINGLLGGEVQMFFATAQGVAQHIQTGRLRAIAVTSVKPFELLPTLPTIAATLPGFETASIVGVFAPAKTPAAVINRLNREIVQALTRDEVKKSLLSLALVPVISSPQESGATMRADMARMESVIKQAGIRAQ